MRPPGTAPTVTASWEAGGRYSSGWHSPVPYLFGGLAAMLGLIGFALLLLACSHRNPPSSSAHAEGDDEMQEAAWACYEEKMIVVIMAGDEEPTHLATPSCSSSFFGDRSAGELG